MRFHKKIFFPEEHQAELKALTEHFKTVPYGYTEHCLDNLKYRALDIEDVLLFIKDRLQLDYTGIFEYYTDEAGKIDKICYRADYGERIDLILVLGKDKAIITIYVNSRDDQHETLNETLYQRQ